VVGALHAGLDIHVGTRQIFTGAGSSNSKPNLPFFFLLALLHIYSHNFILFGYLETVNARTKQFLKLK